MLFLNGTIILIHYSNLFIHYAIFIRIHVRFNQSLFEYAIIQNAPLIEIIQNTIFNQKHRNVKENVAKCSKMRATYTKT